MNEQPFPGGSRTVGSIRAFWSLPLFALALYVFVRKWIWFGAPFFYYGVLRTLHESIKVIPGGNDHKVWFSTGDRVELGDLGVWHIVYSFAGFFIFAVLVVLLRQFVWARLSVDIAPWLGRPGLAGGNRDADP